MPPELGLCQTVFVKFYDTIHQGRKVVWLHHLGKADVRTAFLKKKYTVSMSDFQYGVLSLLNDADTVTWDEMKAKTSLAGLFFSFFRFF